MRSVALMCYRCQEHAAGQLRLREGGRRLHTQGHVRAFMVIVLEKGIGSLLRQPQIAGFEVCPPKFLPALGAVRGFDEGLLVLLVGPCDPVAQSVVGGPQRTRP